MQTQTLDLDGGLSVRVLQAGAGPMVLLLHGNPDNADEWVPLMESLKGEFCCVAPDLPGYGQRGQTHPLPPGWRYTREAQIKFVDDVLSRLKVSAKVTLVVHDIGGIMGVPWAAANTHRLDGVVYTNTVAYPGFPWFELARRWGATSWHGSLIAKLSTAALGLRQGSLFRRVFERQHPKLSDADLQRFVRDFALNPTAKATTRAQFQILTRADYFDGYDVMLSHISKQVPTVTIWGTGDPYVPDERAPQLLAQKTTMLDGVGHWVPLVGTEPLANAVRTLKREV